MSEIGAALASSAGPNPPAESVRVTASADVAGDLPELGESKADHLALILERSGIGAWELDVRSGAAWRNARHDEIFGYAALLPEWTYERFLEHVLPEDRASVESLYGEALNKGRTWSFECRILRADGERRWISATGRPVTDAEGRPIRLIGHVIDITHIKRDEDRLRTIMHELNHRVRNTLTIVQSIARRAFPDHVDAAQGRRDFNDRIGALARAHALLTDEGWRGAMIEDLVRQSLDPYCDREACRCEGPPLRLGAKIAVSLAMTLNELTTNAIKHGALSATVGQVDVAWRRAEGTDLWALEWTESGGPPVLEPERTSFGMTLIERLMPSEMGGTAQVVFAPEGLRCRLSFQAEPADPAP